MAEAEQPQIWLVSTAGDARSDLMSGYRGVALGLEEPSDSDDILLIEWSAPPDPDLDIDDPEVWRAASPALGRPPPGRLRRGPPQRR